MAGITVIDVFAFDSIILHCEEETDKICSGKDAFVRRGGVVRLMSNEQLDRLDPEGVVDGVGPSLEVFPC